MQKYYVHFYLIVAGAIMLFCLVVYGFCYDHKDHINDDSNPNSQEWIDSFHSAGAPDPIVDDITHDDDTWYYQNSSTCVGYGDWDDVCPRHEVYCGGNKKMGDSKIQAKAVVEALKNGGKHPKCPLLYPGAN